MASLAGWDIERYRDLLRRRALLLQKDPRIQVRFDQSDVANETLTRALNAKQGPAVDDPDAVKIAWLLAIQANIFNDLYRHHYGPEHDIRREEHLQALTDSAQNAAEQFATTDPPPEHAVEAADLSERVDDELTRLPPEEAEVIRLKRRGLTFEQIAAALGIPQSTAAERYYAGVKRLRNRLQGEDPS